MIVEITTTEPHKKKQTFAHTNTQVDGPNERTWNDVVDDDEKKSTQRTQQTAIAATANRERELANRECKLFKVLWLFFQPFCVTSA